MLLQQVVLHNVGCHPTLDVNTNGRLTAIVGENDVGKSVLLRAIRSALSDQRLAPELLRKSDKEGRIELTLGLDAADSLPEEWRSGSARDEFSFYRPFGRNECFVRAIRYVDDEVDNMTAGLLNVPDQRILLGKLGISPIPKRSADQRKALEEYLSRTPLKRAEKWSPTPFSRLAEHLPRVRWASADEMKDPSEILRSEALDSLRAKLAENPEVRTMIDQLMEVAGDEIRNFSDRVLPAMRKHLPAVESIHIIPSLDPTRLLPNVSVQIDTGDGPRESSQIGHGSLRRMWLGLIDSRTDDAPAAKGGEIWLYDEPELALHFSAQRHLTRVLRAVGSPQSRRQTIVATHALGLIDSLHLNEVRLLEADDTGQRICVAPPDASQAQIGFGRALGLRNSAVLFERSVLLVEGDSEERALPILYSRLFGSEIDTDGVVVVNLESCGSWRAVVKTFLNRRHDVVELLLDSDCLSQASTATINSAALTECGCDSDFLRDHVTFVGTKEFEDAFPSGVIARVLNEHFPRQDGNTWNAADVDTLKKAEKFSVAIQDAIYKLSVPTSRGGKGKPRFAERLASACAAGEIPEAVSACLRRVRARANP